MELIDTAQWARFLGAFLIVMGLMGALALVMKRLNNRLPHAAPGKKRRLGIVESLPIDPKRKLVLLRRGDTGHLVILGANGETLIESGIELPQDEGELPQQADNADTAEINAS